MGQLVTINSEYIREAFKNKNISQRGMSIALSLQSNSISASLTQGSMPEDRLEKICAILDIPIEKAKITADEKSQVGVEQPSKKDVISYICDIGKIQTDILREIKELHDSMTKLLTAVNTNVIDTTSELHQVAEGVKNHSVATNQNMNKIHNLMKYGGK